MRVKNLIQSFLNIFFASRCVVCNTLLAHSNSSDPEDVILCHICKEALETPNTGQCSICGDIFHTSAKEHLCFNCKKHPPLFDRIYSAYLYGGPLAKLITKMKFTPSPELAKWLGLMMYNTLYSNHSALFTNTTFDLIIPIPLHSGRLKTRGFNQAALLAKILSKKSGIPLELSMLRRNGKLTPQVGKNRKERLKRMEGVFYIKNATNIYDGKNILLIDDVVTTTATVRAASKILLKEGEAKSVTVLALARTT